MRFSLLLFGCALAYMAMVADAVSETTVEGGPANGLLAPALPVPKHASPQARGVLQRPVNVARSQKVPRTDADWMALVSAANASMASRIAQVSDGVDIRKEQLAGVTVRWVSPQNVAADKADKLLVNIHGGGYTLYAGDASVMEAVLMSKRTGYPSVSIDYRMPPRSPFPAGLEDSLAVYRALLKTRPASAMILFGTSAGGGLAAATIVAARDEGLDMPAAAILNTPWSDLSKSGDSYFSNHGVDPVLPAYDGVLEASARLYAGEYPLQHPLISPVYADYNEGFPPSMLITGTRDLLLSCTVRLHRALRRANQSSELHVFESMWHAFYSDGRLEESQELSVEMKSFIDRHF